MKYVLKIKCDKNTLFTTKNEDFRIKWISQSLVGYDLISVEFKPKNEKYYCFLFGKYFENNEKMLNNIIKYLTKMFKKYKIKMKKFELEL